MVSCIFLLVLDSHDIAEELGMQLILGMAHNQH